MCHSRLRLHQRIGHPCRKKIGHALAARDLVSEHGRRTLALGPSHLTNHENDFIMASKIDRMLSS
jgi:hypothetical protein